MMRRSVDLPDPLAPTNATCSPRSRRKSRPCRMVSPPNRFTMPETVRSGTSDLTVFAEVRSACGDNRAQDNATAAGTGAGLTLKYLQRELVAARIALDISVGAECRAASANRILQYRLNTHSQTLELSAVETTGGPEWMNFCRKQRLVGVDVAKTGDQRLVQERRLDGHPTSTKLEADGLRCHLFPEGLQTETRPRRNVAVRVRPHKIDAAELSRIVEAQLGAVLHLKPGAHEPIIRRALRTNEHRPRHASMEGEGRAVVQACQRKLPPAVNALDDATGDGLEEGPGIRMSRGPLPGEGAASQALSHDADAKVPHHRLDFG